MAKQKTKYEPCAVLRVPAVAFSSVSVSFSSSSSSSPSLRSYIISMPLKVSWASATCQKRVALDRETIVPVKSVSLSSSSNPLASVLCSSVGW